MSAPEQPDIFMTDQIVDMVEGTFRMLNQEWYSQFQDHYPPVGYRRDMKTLRLLLPRRSGITTASERLWDAHPTSIIYFPQGFFREEFVKRRGLERNTPRVRTLPYNIEDLIDRGRGRPAHWYEHDLVIFDGVSRMKHSMVEEVCQYHDPHTTLFVLLG